MSRRTTTAVSRFPLGAVLLVLAACTSTPAAPPPGKDAPLQTKTEAEVVELAQARATAVASAAGSKLENWRTSTGPCEGRNGETADDGRWSLAGFAGIPVAATEQIDTLARIKEAWREQGYEITEDRVFADNTGGALSARDTGTGFTITLTTTVQRTQIGLIMASSCYQPANGEDPASA